MQAVNSHFRSATLLTAALVRAVAPPPPLTAFARASEDELAPGDDCLCNASLSLAVAQQVSTSCPLLEASARASRRIQKLLEQDPPSECARRPARARRRAAPRRSAHTPRRRARAARLRRRAAPGVCWLSSPPAARLSRRRHLPRGLPSPPRRRRSRRGWAARRSHPQDCPLPSGPDRQVPLPPRAARSAPPLPPRRAAFSHHPARSSEPCSRAPPSPCKVTHCPPSPLPPRTYWTRLAPPRVATPRRTRRRCCGTSRCRAASLTGCTSSFPRRAPYASFPILAFARADARAQVFLARPAPRTARPSSSAHRSSAFLPAAPCPARSSPP